LQEICSYAISKDVKRFAALSCKL